ncbi:casein kinase substrate phosphoprotein PP28-domain-containing protein [Lipomyces arxii]|uniref:casein kinase substrate phosphoprotein PP28-domain-containing protein n=1 Tax=Lipomyces arxii TaxID=56418 RepID=UPI0034CFBF0B
MAPRGGAKGRKPTRGGGKHFSRGVRGQEGEADGFDGIVVPDSELESADPWRSRARSVSSGSGESDSESEGSSDRDVSPPPPAPVTVSNPNRAAESSSGSTSSAPQLSRREREAMQAAAAKEKYWKLHAEGKTDQAKADLARLAIIRKEREEKAKQRKAEQEARDAEQKAKAALQGRRK